MPKELTISSDGATLGFYGCSIEQKRTVIRWLKKHQVQYRGIQLTHLLNENAAMKEEMTELRTRNAQLEHALTLCQDKSELLALAELIQDVFAEKNATPTENKRSPFADILED